MSWPAIDVALLTEDQLDIIIYLIRAFLAVTALLLGIEFFDYQKSKKDRP